MVSQTKVAGVLWGHMNFYYAIMADNSLEWIVPYSLKGACLR